MAEPTITFADDNFVVTASRRQRDKHAARLGPVILSALESVLSHEGLREAAEFFSAEALYRNNHDARLLALVEKQKALLAEAEK
jgi:hypothetical protein